MLWSMLQKDKEDLNRLSEKMKLEKDQLFSKKAAEAVYHFNSDEIEAQFKKLGLLIYQFLSCLSPVLDKDKASYHILK